VATNVEPPFRRPDPFLAGGGRGLDQRSCGGLRAAARPPGAEAAAPHLEARQHAAGPAVQVEVAGLSHRHPLLGQDPVDRCDLLLHPPRQLERQARRGGCRAGIPVRRGRRFVRPGPAPGSRSRRDQRRAVGGGDTTRPRHVASEPAKALVGVGQGQQAEQGGDRQADAVAAQVWAEASSAGLGHGSKEAGTARAGFARARPPRAPSRRPPHRCGRCAAPFAASDGDRRGR
jgi:hypothetical protein